LLSIPNGTLSIEVPVSGNIGLEGHATFGIIHLDDDGNIAMGTLSEGLGLNTGVGVSPGGLAITVTDADTIGDLPGPSVNYGIGGTVYGSGGAGIDGVLMHNPNSDDYIKGITGYAFFGPEIPFYLLPVYAHGNLSVMQDIALLTFNANTGHLCIGNCSLSDIH
jgi:hypothetical protein